MAYADVAEFRCLVGGLSPAIDDGDLKKAFSAYGDIVDCVIIRDPYTGTSQGFGYITFKTELSVKDAILKMNGKNLDGYIINVIEAPSSASKAWIVSWDGSNFDITHKDAKQIDRMIASTDEPTTNSQTRDARFGGFNMGGGIFTGGIEFQRPLYPPAYGGHRPPYFHHDFNQGDISIKEGDVVDGELCMDSRYGDVNMSGGTVSGTVQFGPPPYPPVDREHSPRPHFDHYAGVNMTGDTVSGTVQFRPPYPPADGEQKPLPGFHYGFKQDDLSNKKYGRYGGSVPSSGIHITGGTFTGLIDGKRYNITHKDGRQIGGLVANEPPTSSQTRDGMVRATHEPPTNSQTRDAHVYPPPYP